MSWEAFKTEQNALSTAAELVVAATGGRRRAVEIKNTDTSISVYLGQTSGVTSSTGHLVKAGESFVFEDYGGDIYAIAASGTPTVTIIYW